MSTTTDDDGDDALEQSYTRGSRMALLLMLQHVLKHLGYDDPEAAHVKWIAERELTVGALRDVCRDHGDNDWPDDLSLADVVEKHLGRHLGE